MPIRPHTKLDHELEALGAQIARLGGMAEAQVAASLDAVSRRDSSIAERTIASDHRLNDLQDEIESAAVQVLALRQPMGRDLREIVAILKIANDLERIGDLAKNVARRALVLNREEPVKLTRGLGRMGRQTLVQLKDVLDAYAARDVDRAISVRNRDEDIDELYNSLFREFLTYMMEDPRMIGLCTHLLFIAKNIERIGDHATNIAELVYYIKEARPVPDDRPRGGSELADMEPPRPFEIKPVAISKEDEVKNDDTDGPDR